MKTNLNRMFLLLIFTVMALGAWASVSEYSFTSSAGTYTEITGGTVLGTAANDNESFNAIPLGFTFTYNGVAYNTVSVQTNAFLALGDVVATSNLALSTGTTNNVVAALNRDLVSRADGELMYLLSGAEPNRVFTVQWKNYRRVPTSTANDVFNFQIQLQENGNKVVFAYGAFTAILATTAQTVQVGLRGDANTDFNNRSTTTDWTATTAGTANNASCRISNTVFPPTGLNFTFAPPQAGTPPLAAQNPNPANNAVNVSIGANLSWTSGGGTVSGYKVYFGTDNPPSNLVNGTIQTELLYNHPTDLVYSTAYYWKIVPFNDFGDALDCPVWQFTTLADPTVTTYPYVQNFDAATPPALPLGWSTLNANGDTYTWETYTGTAQTEPNSVRIRYNTTLAMDDWLITPPLQLTQALFCGLNFFYRANSASYPEALAVYWGTAPNAASLTNQLFVNNSITNVTYEESQSTFLVPATGTYYIGFHGQSAINMFYLYLDSVTISQFSETLNPPTNLTAVIQNNNNVHLAWTAPAQTRVATGYKVYRDGALINTIANPATLVYDDLALAVGTYSYTVTATYTAGESVPAGPVSVTITPVLNPPLNLAATVTGNDVTLNWVSPEAPPQGQWITWCTDILGNSIGTNAAAVFDVAHRFTQSDLTAVAGGTISQVKFVPNYANCVYTVKVWTGGSATNAGTLVSSQVVPNFVEDDWNLVILNTPVPIPATGDVYIGFECNTQGGYPAGCDSGPQIEGKGNMMYFQGEWTTLTALAPTLTYNWLIQTFVTTGAANKAVALTPIAEHQAISYSSAPLALSTDNPVPARDRAITGFKVYRDGTLIGTITDPAVTTHTDIDLPNGNYVYGVTATYTAGESVPATVNVTVNVQLAPVLFGDGYESYPDFALIFAPWTLVDTDQAPTYGFSGIEFPGSAGPMAYIVFNPGSTTPPITTLTAHGGVKMAASFAATTPPNNDWMITPRMTLGTGSALKFYAKSHTAQYGLERFRVGVSTLPTIIPQGFQYVSGTTHVEAPVAWTEYVYDLAAYDNQSVYIAIRCVSNDAFVFYVDDFAVHTNGGSVAGDDPLAPALTTALSGNYPNPFNPETTISYSVKDTTPVSIGIYNVKGQLVKTLVNAVQAGGSHSVVWNGVDNNGRPVSSGVYYYKMIAGKYSSTKKMIMMK